MEHVLAQLEREQRECVAEPEAVLGAEANDAKAVEDVTEAEKTLRTPRSSSPSHSSHTSHSPSHSSHRGCLWSDALTAPSVASTPSSPHGTSLALTASTSSPQLTQLGKYCILYLTSIIYLYVLALNFNLSLLFPSLL